MVEDHPFDYKNFEGLIPKGEYGGGTVIVWDEGTYEPIEPVKGKNAQEKYMLQQLAAGSLKIKLHGHKLRGEFALVKTHGMGENAWLLIKHKDDFASARDITKMDKSVVSGKTIGAMEKNSEKVWKDGKEEVIKKPAKLKTKAPAKKASAPRPRVKKSIDSNIAGILKKAPGAAMPQNITPMLATLVGRSF